VAALRKMSLSRPKLEKDAKISKEFLNWLEIFINSLDKFQSSPYNNMQERYCKRYFIS
jgi:hypothetical protein